MSILFYKKPEYSNAEGALNQSSCQRYVERTTTSRAVIPEELSFKNVISDRAMPPCSLQDFLDYLIYVTHDAENLQFYLWYKDYCKRFNSTPTWKRDKSPLWTETANDTPKPPCSIPRLATPKKPSPISLSPYASPLPSPMPLIGKKPLPLAPSPAQQFQDFSFKARSDLPPPSPLSFHSNHTEKSHVDSGIDLSDEHTEVSVDEKTRSTQPFREEVERIADHYLRTGAPRELNLSFKERQNALRAVEQTTHPTAFLEVASLVETTLRYHSHRNFVRWSICNGNKPRVLVLRSLAIFVLSCTLALSFVLILSHYSRWYRLSAIPLCFFASVNLIAARQGLCVLLHRRRTREARPWELDEPEYLLHNSRHGFGPRMDDVASLEGRVGSAASSDKTSAFGPSNDFRHEPWVHSWEKRSVWRKIRITKIKVDRNGLRNIQDRIIWQAEAWGLLVTLVFVTAVCAFPEFGFF